MNDGGIVEAEPERAGLLGRLLGFGGISAVGLALDCGLFAGLSFAGIGPLPANLVSAGTAVTFVFFASVRQVFRYRGRAVGSRYAAYIIYQIVAVVAASALIAWLHRASAQRVLVCKLAVLPLTFAANFTVMRLITRERSERPR